MMRLVYLYAVCAVFGFQIGLCTDLNENNAEVTRVKRDGSQDNRDLTVLLVNDQQRELNTRHGRYHSIKPVIGLLTSTARTFIQDGVTTEFATQILGTTLDNGRIYAQLLTKSSLVLYNKPSRVDDTSFIRQTSLPNEGKWSVKQDLGFIDPSKFVLKNTDFIQPPSNKMYTVYASKPSYVESTQMWDDQFNKVPNDILSNDLTGRKVPQNVAQKFGDSFTNDVETAQLDDDKYLVKPAILESANLLHRNRPLETIIDFVSLDSKKDSAAEVFISKVKPDGNLPTFTVKNEFSPIFYYIDNVESKSSFVPSQSTKVPKKLFGSNSEKGPKKTFTYAGFADFTTEVGDTVIVFTPNTARDNKPGGVEILHPSVKLPRLGSKVTHLSGDIPIPTKVFNPRPAFTRRPTIQDNRDDKALNNDEQSLKDVLYENDKLPDSNVVQSSMNFGFNMDVIQPSESATIGPHSTQNPEDLGVLPIHTYKSKATEPLKNIKPSSTYKYKDDESENYSSVETTTEENTSSEELDQETTDYSDEATESGLSTTENEDLTSSTEEDDLDEKDTTCTNGIYPVKTMTTQYKTLTYLTTYFIPLDDEGTTTSVKSDVVIESTQGYLTNFQCRHDDYPTATVVDTTVKSTLLTNEDRVESITSVKSSSSSGESQPQSDDTKTAPEHQDENETTTTTASQEDKQSEKENRLITTEKQTTTTMERVEVSTSTEQTKETTTEGKNIVTENSENEIDLIYKTLYTTYTYFTTFFQGESSTIASHKSVVTNVITSTLDLAKLDPSIINALENGEIESTAASSVRPTQALNSVIDLFINKNVLDSVENDYVSQMPTPALNDADIKSIKPDTVKKYLTTYTYFTTIFVGSDANVCSRSEIHTNFVGPESLLPTKTKSEETESSKSEFDFRNCKKLSADSEELKTEQKIAEPSPVLYDMLLSVEAKPVVSSDDSIVVDLKSSSSKGERKVLDDNNIFDDQVSSETNIDEIVPSPTLLLQTSYTTFTYFTTLYMGKDSSKIKSHLETITNVVTETIAPKKEPDMEEPITYYTTFTYWTTLYKDKMTTITSREEVISNVVTPTISTNDEKIKPSTSPIDTSPIEVVTAPQKNLESATTTLKNERPEDEKQTFFTTYTYFTTFYVGNTSQIRSSLETITNIVDNTKIGLEDNQLGRSVGSNGNKNVIDGDKKPTKFNKEQIQTTKVPELSVVPTVISGTYIDNLFAEVVSPKPTIESENKKVVFSQVAVISGDSKIISEGKELINDTATTNKTLETEDKGQTEKTEDTGTTVSNSSNEGTTTEAIDADDDQNNNKKKSRLTFTTKKPSFTPVIRPFSSRSRASFNPKRAPIPSGATTITRNDFTPTITATPILKSVKSSGYGPRKSIISTSAFNGSSRRFTGRTSVSPQVPTASTRSSFGKGRQTGILPSSRRDTFRTPSFRASSLDYISRSVSRIRPTISSRFRNGRGSTSAAPVADLSFASGEESVEQQNTESDSEETLATSEPTVQKSTNSLQRFRRPLVRAPGTAVTSRSSLQTTSKRTTPTRGRTAPTTQRTTRNTSPVYGLRARQRPNALFPKRNLFKQPEPEPQIEDQPTQEEEITDDLSNGNFDDQDNEYESSNREEQQISTSSTTLAPKRSPNQVQIKPFSFRRRTKRQIDYGSRKFGVLRRPVTRALQVERRDDSEPDTEAPVISRRTTSRFSPRNSFVNTTPKSQSSSRSSGRQPYIIRGESRASASTTSVPSYRLRNTRPPLRGTTARSRLSSFTTQNTRGRSRSRGTSRASSRFRGNDYNSDSNVYQPIDDGKITVTHHIPTEITIPVVSGRITEYKNVITAKPSVEILLPHQYSTSIDALGNAQLVLASESKQALENGATRLIKFVLKETPTKEVIFTPTTIRGRKTSFSHVVPSTVYNVEYVTSTLAPEISPNVPLANILLSQLLLGNAQQQQQINPLLALQGQGILPPPMPVVQTPVTEFITRPSTYVTTITEAKETVLPITFRGKEILTTIVDPKTKVITATEFITETKITTPTAYLPQMNQNQLYSQLLPFLIQQQQQQNLALQTQNPLLGLAQAPSRGLGQSDPLLQNNLLSSSEDYSGKPEIIELDNVDDYFDDKPSEEEVIEVKKPRPVNKPKAPKPAPHKLTSVVTLYVSGKTPGEFSTVLSTVVTDDTSSVRKREAIYYDQIVLPSSNLPLIDELFSSNSLEELEERQNADSNQLETQSLESIVGEVSKYVRLDSTSPIDYYRTITYKLADKVDTSS